jgi:hypothetical protein
VLLAFVGTAVRRRGEPEEVRAARAPVPVKPILASLRSFDEHARDGVRRAIPLGILMYFLQVDGGRDAFWTFFAAFLVLLTPSKTPTSLASIRVASTIFGVLLLAVASVILANEVLFSFGVVGGRPRLALSDRRRRAHEHWIHTHGRRTDRSHRHMVDA